MGGNLSYDQCISLEKFGSKEFWSPNDCMKNLSFICESLWTNCSSISETLQGDFCRSDSCSPYASCYGTNHSSNSCSCDDKHYGEKCELEKVISNLKQYRHKTFLFVKQKMQLSDSIQFCERNNMTLTKVYDEYHHEWLLKEAFKMSRKLWRIGAKYYEDKATVTYIDGSSIVYAKWFEIPVNQQNGSTCVFVDTKNGEPLWILDDCDKWSNFICESVADFIGDHEKRSGICSTSKCSPYGKCKEVESNQYECICDHDYSGEYCETEKNSTICLQYERKGFSFVKFQLSINEARLYCNQRNMILAKIYNAEHFKWLTDKIGLISKDRWWISANYSLQEGIFVQSDGWRLTYEKWYQLPSDSLSRFQCVSIYFVENEFAYMIPSSCDRKQYFICESVSSTCEETSSEIPAGCHSSSCSPFGSCMSNNNKEPTCQCNENYSGQKCENDESAVRCEEYNGKEYLFVREPQSVPEARQYCGKRGMRLTKIINEQEQEWISSMAYTISSDAWWIGVNDEKNPGIFVFEDGSPVILKNQIYENETRKGNCIFLQTNNEGITVWYRGHCLQSEYFICELVSTTCNRSHYIQEEIYPCLTYENKGFMVVKKYLSFLKAVKFCSTFGMTLMKLYDHSLKIFLFTENNLITVQPYWWIDLHDMNQEGNYTHIDGTPAQFLDWGPNQPDDNDHEENCMATMPQSKSFAVLMNAPCVSPLAFICESLSPNCSKSDNLKSSICKSDSCSPYGHCIEKDGLPYCVCQPLYTQSKCEQYLYTINTKLLFNFAIQMKRGICVVGALVNVYNVYYFSTTNQYKRFGKHMLLFVSVFDELLLVAAFFMDEDIYTRIFEYVASDVIIFCRLIQVYEFFYCGSLLFQECLCLERLVAVMIPLKIKQICNFRVKCLMLSTGILIISFIWGVHAYSVTLIKDKLCTFFKDKSLYFFGYVFKVVFIAQQNIVLICGNAAIWINLLNRKFGQQSSISTKAMKTVKSLIGLSFITFVTSMPFLLFRVLKFSRQIFHSFDYRINESVDLLLRNFALANFALNFFFFLIMSEDFRKNLLCFVYRNREERTTTSG